MDVAHDALRRRQRRLRQWVRHERMTVAMALAEAKHDNGAPRSQNTAWVVEELLIGSESDVLSEVLHLWEPLPADPAVQPLATAIEIATTTTTTTTHTTTHTHNHTHNHNRHNRHVGWVLRAHDQVVAQAPASSTCSSSS